MIAPLSGAPSDAPPTPDFLGQAGHATTSVPSSEDVLDPQGSQALETVIGPNEIAVRLEELKKRDQYVGKIALETAVQRAKLLQIIVDVHGYKNERLGQFAEAHGTNKSDAYELYKFAAYADRALAKCEAESRLRLQYDWPGWRKIWGAIKRDLKKQNEGTEGAGPDKDEGDPADDTPDPEADLIRERDNLVEQVKAATQQYRNERVQHEEICEERDRLIAEVIDLREQLCLTRQALRDVEMQWSHNEKVLWDSPSTPSDPDPKPKAAAPLPIDPDSAPLPDAAPNPPPISTEPVSDGQQPPPPGVDYPTLEDRRRSLEQMIDLEQSHNLKGWRGHGAKSPRRQLRADFLAWWDAAYKTKLPDSTIWMSNLWDALAGADPMRIVFEWELVAPRTPEPDTPATEPAPLSPPESDAPECAQPPSEPAPAPPPDDRVDNVIPLRANSAPDPKSPRAKTSKAPIGPTQPTQIDRDAILQDAAKLMITRISLVRIRGSSESLQIKAHSDNKFLFIDATWPPQPDIQNEFMLEIVRRHEGRILTREHSNHPRDKHAIGDIPWEAITTPFAEVKSQLGAVVKIAKADNLDKVSVTVNDGLVNFDKPCEIRFWRRDLEWLLRKPVTAIRYNKGIIGATVTGIAGDYIVILRGTEA
jgi:hypothetical protein